MTGWLLAFLPLVGLWALAAWRVRVERGKVRLTESELAMRRLAAGLRRMERTLGEALLPALRRANDAMSLLAAASRADG